MSTRCLDIQHLLKVIGVVGGRRETVALTEVVVEWRACLSGVTAVGDRHARSQVLGANTTSRRPGRVVIAIDSSACETSTTFFRVETLSVSADAVNAALLGVEGER